MKVANPIRLFAVICVAVTSAFVMVTEYRLLNVLSGPGWCATALGAGKASSSDGTPIKGLEVCNGLLTIQLKSLADNSFINGGVIALCLLTLMVIVVAGAKLDLKANRDGVDLNMSRETPAAKAAKETAGAAVDKAAQISNESPNDATGEKQ